jgi:hypothetical protein|tara:strand:+ start:255 stop:446 length:192 start_codon:yes stop_codon:yes gene_type:complete
MTKIRVNPSNSKVLAGKLFITELKALLVSKSKVLAELIEYDNNIVFKGTKLVEYNGPYIRLKA